MDVVTALAAIRDNGLTAEADILEAAIDEALCDEPIVRIAGGMTADQIAEKVVAKLIEHTQVVGAKLVQKPLPDGVPPVPWVYHEKPESVTSADDYCLFESLDVGCGDFGNYHDDVATLKAIVAAVNAYYAPQTPAEAAASNSETGIPDTAGYPLPEGTSH